MIDHNEHLMLKVFHDYYVRNLSQNDIALRHHISRKKVQRFLSKGRDENLVEVKIRYPSRMFGELEAVLEDKYGLREVIVSNIDEDNAANRSIALRNACEMAAGYFLRVLTSGMTVSLSWSEHLAEMLEIASRKLSSLHEKPKDVNFVLTLGSVVGCEPDLQTLEATRHFASLLGGKIHVLMAPNFITASDIYTILMGDPQIQQVVDMARGADVAYFGIGAMGKGGSRLIPSVSEYRPEIMSQLEKAGAVGDINGRVFDARGAQITTELDRQHLGLSIEAIKALPLTVGVATGVGKYEAIKAVLTGRILKVLVTDVCSARKLAEE